MNRNFNVPESTAVAEHFKTHFDRPREMSDTLFFESHLYFITARFDVPLAGQLNEFGKVYYHVSKQLFGNRLGKKRKRQPLCYAFVDADASRTGRSDMFNCQWPHIHSVILAPPTHSVVFREAIRNLPPAVTLSAKTFEVVPFNASKGSVDGLVSYCSKGCRQAASSHKLQQDLWTVFPR